MPLQPPVLDNRTFQQILDEARRRIPRYTPEWTDFNDSDPGITLLQLFAWLTEMTLYRLNQVPELSYIKFLQMLGIEREPAKPAVAHLTFNARAGTTQSVSVPQGARVAGPAGADGVPLIYETEQGIDLVRAALAQVQVFNGFDFAVVSDRNEFSEAPFQPFGWRPQSGSALYLGFVPPTKDNPPSNLFPSRITIRVFLPEGAEAPQPIACTDEVASAPPPVELRWEYKPDDSSPWQRLSVYRDETQAFTRSGYIALQGPQKILPSQIGRVQDPHYWLRARIVSGSYTGAPQVDLIRVNTVMARNLATVREEILGRSDGAPSQAYALRYKPVQAETFQLAVQDEAGEFQPWRLVSDFLSSGPDEAHFTLQAMTSQVRFGDGRRGRIPSAGRDIVARFYRYGGGEAGNAARDTIKTLQSAIVGVESVTNLRRAEGGRDEESTEQAKERAAQLLRHRDRAVTADDLAALAKRVGGVACTKALPLAHPEFPGIEVPGAVTVLVVPRTQDKPPQPSQELLEVVCKELNPRRMVTTELFVRGPKFAKIRVEARVAMRPNVAFDQVAQSISDHLDSYFDPLKWGFGEDIYPTNIFGEILKLKDKGVVTVEAITVFVDDRQHDAIAQAIALPRDTMPYASGHEINAVPARDVE